MARTSEGALLTDRHRREQVRLAITADSQARRVWDATLDPADLQGSQPIWKNAILDLLQTWWKISADTAADYLPRFREAETGDGAIDVAMPRFDRRKVAGQIDWLGTVNVLWHMARGENREAAYAAARSLFLGVFHEAVLTGGRSTVERWAKADPRAVGWRRVSDGDPCAFCAMLVTRGPVYTSADKAGLRASDGRKYHAHCGCTVEVIYGDWRPTEREQQWIDDYYRAAESLPARTPRTQDAILPIMRRDGAFRDSCSRRATPEAGEARKGRARMRKTDASSGASLTSKTTSATWPEHVEPLTKTVINHILHGEGDGERGGHLYGTGVPGKTEFPESWSADDIVEAIGRTMKDPDWHRPAANERALHQFGKLIEGVQVEVKAYGTEGRYVIDQAYPVGGAGVTRNSREGKIDIGDSKSKQWRKKTGS